ncbi:guanylate kinase [Synergistales bacterium]|nr:guanylate kinase [Synergistales bacterium]
MSIPEIDKSTLGRLFVLSGPSGVGKGTLREHALSGLGMTYSISCTTRSPRDGEREGVDYHFISKEDFDERVRRGMFLEYAFVHGNYYGTQSEDIRTETKQGRDVLLEIDVQGARQVRRGMPSPESVLIFVAPPSLEALETRLRCRGTESEDKILLRLKNAKVEMEAMPEYDHIIVNDDLEQACGMLSNIVLEYRKTR